MAGADINVYRSQEVSLRELQRGDFFRSAYQEDEALIVLERQNDQVWVRDLKSGQVCTLDTDNRVVPLHLVRANFMEGD